MKTSGMVVGMSLLVLARGALASTGMPGLDTVFTTIDEGMGSVGYIFYIAALGVSLVSFMTGHTYMALGMLGLFSIGGALLGHRSELGGMLNLSLGATLDGMMPVIVEMLP
jgi:hypothetical protein